MAWIESHTVLIRHRKIIELAKDLRLKPVYVLGHLHALWHAALEQQEDGDLSVWSDPFIAESACYDGDAPQFVSLLQKHKWLDGKILHDWWEYAGRYLEAKYKTSNPVKLAKMRDKLTVVCLKSSLEQPKDIPPNPTIPTNLTKPKEVSRFAPPSIEDVKSYCQERKNGVNYQKWHDFYTGKGWMVGKNKMKDWKAAVRTWEEKKEEVKEWPKHPKSCSECFGNGYIIAPGSGGKFSCREKFEAVAK